MSWNRHRDSDGSTAWTKTIGGTHVVVTNMQGQSVAFTGTGAHVLVHESTQLLPTPWHGTWREVRRCWTVGEAKAWAEQHYGRASI